MVARRGRLRRSERGRGVLIAHHFVRRETMSTILALQRLGYFVEPDPVVQDSDSTYTACSTYSYYNC
jgi:hypothetical protein